ncbi:MULTISPECIES: AI-2E family transporter [Mycolicibacterium]|uniref:AI-2E family transporter n=1 Tax=Mycolicibacterium phocaicum TaxID=319706 RepID=A0A7I7ZRN9_9MYCO|nr:MULTISPECIES: AI-2E family transporter [Mycolicibacterium]RUP33388.1 MAG: AI-2E family transporter [Mycolicibacterium sp.]TLH81002.1 AI-2E family transporter [Mycolicibacterium phocaicum]BBZ56462.1 AI-2E family transporter [Mycolicibacterium phocaicum]
MSHAHEAVDPVVRKAAAWSWRLLVIFGAVLALLWVVIKLEVIVVPVLLATLAAAFLLPAVDLLTARGLPRGAAVAAVLLSSIVVMGGILTFVVSQFIDGAPALVEQVTKSIDGARKWLTEGPILHLSSEQINSVGQSAIDALKNNQSKLTSGVFSTAGALTEIITGMLLVLFTLIFLLHGGRDIYAFVTKIVPASVRERVRDAGRAGFGSLIGYVRATFVVALVDAVGIGTGLAIMGVPLALPLASLVFLGAFVPLVGAVLTGFVAVVVALIAKGWIYALIALGLIIAVQQLEAHVLQPIVMGRAVSVHPLAVVLAIAGGGVMAGVIGALIAVPIVAFLNSAIRVLVAKDPDAEQAELLAEAGSVAAATVSQGADAPATDGPPGAADPQR